LRVISDKQQTGECETASRCSGTAIGARGYRDLQHWGWVLVIGGCRMEDWKNGKAGRQQQESRHGGRSHSPAKQP